MALGVKVVDFDNDDNTETVDRLPDSCPRCHRAISPQYFGTKGALSPRRQEIELLFRCPDQKCGRLFLAVYDRLRNESFRLRGIEPWTAVVENFGRHIDDVSPRFGKIMNQALEAELRGLDEVAGPGYRKALEVLVKDFAKYPFGKAFELAERMAT